MTHKEWWEDFKPKNFMDNNISFSVSLINTFESVSNTAWKTSRKGMVPLKEVLEVVRKKLDDMCSLELEKEIKKLGGNNNDLQRDKY